MLTTSFDRRAAPVSFKVTSRLPSLVPTTTGYRVEDPATANVSSAAAGAAARRTANRDRSIGWFPERGGLPVVCRTRLLSATPGGHRRVDSLHRTIVILSP